MYCILQTNHWDNVEKIISVDIQSNLKSNLMAQFKQSVLNSGDILSKTIVLDNVNLETLKLDNSLEDGSYLLFENNQYMLVNKETKIVTGFIFNSEVKNVHVLTTWKLVAQESPIKEKPLPECDLGLIKKSSIILYVAQQTMEKEDSLARIIFSLGEKEEAKEIIIFDSNKVYNERLFREYIPNANIRQLFDPEYIKRVLDRSTKFHTILVLNNHVMNPYQAFVLNRLICGNKRHMLTIIMNSTSENFIVDDLTNLFEYKTNALDNSVLKFRAHANYIILDNSYTSKVKTVQGVKSDKIGMKQNDLLIMDVNNKKISLWKQN